MRLYMNMDDASSIIAFHNGNTFEEKLACIANFLATKNNIIALVGAGISVSCGIPDFRSEDGLYNTLNYQVSIAAWKCSNFTPNYYLFKCVPTLIIISWIYASTKNNRNSV